MLISWMEQSMLELGGLGHAPQEMFEKWMLKHYNLDKFPHKMHISSYGYFIILPLDIHGSLQHL